MNALELRRRTLGKGVYKKTVEGNPAIAQGSLARRYPGITMQGWTEQDSTTGAQLFNSDSVVDGIISSGTVVENNNFVTSDFIPVTSGNVYSRSGTGSSGNFFYDKDKVFLQNVSGTVSIKTPDNAAYVRFCIEKDAYDVNKVMFNEGSTVLPYEPYTGRKPSPSPDYPQEIVSAGNWNKETQKWEYEIEVTGANLLDAKKYAELNSRFYEIGPNGGVIQIASDGRETGSVPVVHTLPPGTFYIRGDKTNAQVIIDGVTFSTSAPGGYVILTLEKETDIAYKFYGPSDTSYPSEEYFPMASRVQDATYEPYRTPQTVALTADRPLTKWDKLTKKNGVWGWEYGSAEIVCDGSETWFLTGATSDEYQGFALKSSDYNAMDSNLRLVCDKFAYSTSDKINTCRQEKSEYGLRFVVSTEYVPNNTVAEFKNWLQSNPITVLYQLAEPVFVPLSASEQEQMNELYTFRPTTVLSNDCECEMTLTYKTKKSLEVTT